MKKSEKISRIVKIAGCIAISFLCFSLSVGTLQAAQQIYKSNVTTANHVRVQGTHVAVIPPAGAVKAVSFRGFEIESRGVVLEIVERGQSYEAFIKTLTEQELASQGVTVTDTAKVVLNERPATLMTGTKKMQAPEGATAEEIEDQGLVLFVFGDDKICVTMYGYYLLSDRSAGIALRTSMLSAVLVSEQSENSGGAYTLSAAGTSLKFKGEVNYTRRYEADSGGNNSGDGGTLALYTATMLNKMVPQTDRVKFAEETFATYMSSYEHTIGGTRNVTFAGLFGVELIADFDGAARRSRTSSGGVVRRPVPGKGYQTVLFDSAGRVFVFQGIALRDAEIYLEQFKKITSSFALTK